MTARTLLTGALDMIGTRATKHTTRALARTSAGVKCSPTSPYAVQWCAIGAVLKTAKADRIPNRGPVCDAVDLLRLVANDRGFVSPSRLNDVEGHAGAARMIRRALTLYDERSSHGS